MLAGAYAQDGDNRQRNRRQPRMPRRRQPFVEHNRAADHDGEEEILAREVVPTPPVVGLAQSGDLPEEVRVLHGDRRGGSRGGHSGNTGAHTAYVTKSRKTLQCGPNEPAVNGSSSKGSNRNDPLPSLAG